MELNLNESRWKLLYRIGAVCAIAALAVMVAEILLTAVPGGSKATVDTSTITGWFDLFAQNRFMAMRNLGLINIIATTLTIPVFLSLFGLHRKENSAFAGLSLILFLAAYVIFMADNSAFPMLALSKKYLAAGSEGQRVMLKAAGEALIARGSSHTPGTFPGFFLSELANIFICIVILKGKVFNNITGWMGIIAFGFLLIFETVSSFFPALFAAAMIFAMIGGIAALAWYVMLARGFLKASKSK